MLELKILSSLEKIFPDSTGAETARFSAMRNEPVSFQIAYKNADGERYVQPFYTVIDTDLEISLISQYKIGYVPVAQCVNIPEDEYYDRKTPGLFPDPLLPRGTNDRVENDGFWAPRFYEQDEKNLAAYGSPELVLLYLEENTPSCDIAPTLVFRGDKKLIREYISRHQLSPAGEEALLFLLDIDLIMYYDKQCGFNDYDALTNLGL